MKQTIDRLIDLIEANHQAYPALPSRYVAQHERRLGYHLPDELHRFYTRCNGALLFVKAHYSPFRILPLVEVKRTRVYIFGKDSAKYAPNSWYAICDVLDGNYIGIDLSSTNDSDYPISDCLHETHGIPGEDRVIAKSFMQFLQRLLKSQGRGYWLQKNFINYGWR